MTAKVLVVGGDSALGAAIAARLRHLGVEFSTTSRRNLPRHEALFLDLAADTTGWEIPERYGTVFLCAAETSIQRCERHAAETRRVNVDATLELVDCLRRAGAFCVFPSTNLVFDGSRSHTPVDAPFSPVTEYGRQKVAVERRLSGFDDVSVVRLSKVLANPLPLFQQWHDELREGKIIQPIRDARISPIPRNLVASTLVEIGLRRAAGCFQISAVEDVSYEEIANRLADRMRVTRDRIAAVSADESGVEVPFPRHTTLDTTSLQDRLGLQIPEVWKTIEASFPVREAGS